MNVSATCWFGNFVCTETTASCNTHACRKKLSQKSDELERALKDGEKRAAQLVTLQGEKDRAVAQLRATQERMKQGPANAPQLAGDARTQVWQLGMAHYGVHTWQPPKSMSMHVRVI